GSAQYDIALDATENGSPDPLTRANPNAKRACSIPRTKLTMRRAFPILFGLILIALPLVAQTKRLWVLRSTGEMVEYDSATFGSKQAVKLPVEAGRAPAGVDVNHVGQILFAPTVSLPLSEGDVAAPHKVWIWNGQAAASIDLGIARKEEP